MVAVEFRVDGLPPKKDGATSLWRKGSEVDKVVALRLAAHEAMAGRPPFDGPVKLTLAVHVHENTRQTGDLDNMVSGVLDSLQAAVGDWWRDCPAWDRDEVRDVLPDKAVALVDDVQVVEIAARKAVGEFEAGEEWYEVRLQQGSAC